MAKLRMFAVQDAKSEVFHRPFFDAHLGSALRSWEEVCNQPEAPMCKFPADFVLYEVGEFDDLTGAVVAHSPIRRVSSALEVKRRPSDPLPLRDSGVAVNN